MSFNEFINIRRKELGMSIDELVIKSGIPKGTLSKITAGINTNPTLSTVETLCKALNCTLNDAVGYVEENQATPKEMVQIKKYRQLDAHGKKMVDFTLNEEYERCISISEEDDEVQEIEIRRSYYKVSAGTGFNLGNDDEWETISIPDTPDARKADFALTIKGNSMEPVYFDGDIVLVKEQSAIDVGQIGIFIIEGDGYIKKYGGDRLISLNARYDDIIFSKHDEESIRCVGKVIGRV